jgi:hypothetical protein
LENLIGQITVMLNIDAQTASMVVAGLLDLARQSLGPEAGGALIAAIPGASDLLGNDLLAGTGLSLGALLGHPVDNTQALLDLAKDAGVSVDHLGTIGDMLLSYVQRTAGGDTANQLSGALPGLAHLG